MAFTDVEMSILAQLAYLDIPSDQSLYRVLDDNKTWLANELGPSYQTQIDNLIKEVKGKDYRVVASTNTSASGFAAYAFKTPDNEVVVAARGTQLDQINDLATDAGLALSVETQQHRDMETFVNNLERYGYDGYYFTGHSLGGNVATHGAVCINDPSKVKGVYTYNAPGFNEAYWIYNGWKLGQINNIKNFQNEYDYVSSILNVPGEVIIVDSGKDGWWHGGFDDHSICNYSINEDGTFNKNKTGRKSVQTVAGTVIGMAGEDIARKGYLAQIVAYKILNLAKNVYMTRDFSDDSKQKMLGLVSQVESEKWCDFTDWVGDRWYDFEDLIGVLDVRQYINNLNSYHKKVIDKNNATAKTIEKIFAEVRSVDASYANTLGSTANTLEQLKRYVEQMTQIVAPGKGNFNGHTITGTLSPIIKDVSQATIQQIVDSLVQEIDGKKVYDDEAILEYIKKDPGEMTDEEMQAVLNVISDMQDTVVYYKTQWTMGDDLFGADFLHAAGWEKDDVKYNSFTAASVHYHNQYASILCAILEQGADSNTFAAEILKFSNDETDLSILGLEASTTVGKIFGSSSVAAYAAKWKSEHIEQYLAKIELSGSEGAELFNKIKQVDDVEKAANQWLEDEGLRYTDKITKYYDEDGNEISADDAGFYDRDYTIAEIDASANVSASLYDGTFDVGENGDVQVVVGNAEAHAGISAGLYVIGPKGDRQFMPGVNAEVGASVTAFEADWEQQWLGNENLGLNTEVGVTTGEAGGKAEVNAQLFSEDGSLDVQLNAEAKLEAIAAEAEGSVGVNLLGGEVEATAGVNVGIGAHAEAGYKEGVIKVDAGLSVGLGVSVNVEVDIGGMVDTVVDGAQVAWEGIKDGWNKLWN